MKQGRLDRIPVELSEFIAATSSVIATQPMSLENEMVFIPPDQRRQWEVAHVTPTHVYWRAVVRGRIQDSENEEGTPRDSRHHGQTDNHDEA